MERDHLKFPQKKNEKKLAVVPNSSTKNSICGKTLEVEGEGIIVNESCEKKNNRWAQWQWLWMI